MKRRKTCGVIVFTYLIGLLLMGFACQASSAVSHDASLNWQTLHSQNFKIHYHDGLEGQAKRAAAIAEDVHLRLMPFFNWQPKSATDIVLMDEIDFANGFASPLPSNRIVLWLTPPDDGLTDYGPWLETLITHEYVHTLHLDKAKGLPNNLRGIFGRHPLLFPNIFQPTWLIEGLATLVETDAERGVGRGQSSYFDMLMRMETLHGFKPLKQVNQPIESWPAGVVNYLYGVMFYQYLLERFGEEGVNKLIENYSINLVPTLVDSTFRRTFKITLRQLWSDFQLSMEARYNPQQEKIVAAGLREGQRLSLDGYQTGQSQVLPQGDVVYIRQDGRSQAGLFLKPKGDMRLSERLINLNGSAAIDVSSTGLVVIAQPEHINNATIFYDLYVYDVTRDKLRRLTQGERYRFATWSPQADQLLAVRFARGQHAVDLLDSDGILIKTLWQGERGEIVSHIDWSPVQGEAVATVWRPDGGWNLELLDTEQGQWQMLTQDAAIQLHPSFSLDGKSVIFSADYEGVYNLYQINVVSNEINKLSNVIAGAFHPTYGLNGEIYYTGYHAAGYDIYRFAENEVMTASVVTAKGASYTPLAIADVQADEYAITEYQPEKSLIPTWWSPIFGVGENTVIAGLTTSASDPLNRHNYALSIAADSESRSLFGGIAYSYDRWFPVMNLMLNRGLSRQINNAGELMRVRESDFVQASMDFPFLRLQRQWALHAAYIRDEDHDSYVHQSQLKVADATDHILAVGASYNSARQYPLSISVSNGRLVSLQYEDSDIVRSDYQGKATLLDWREYVSLGGEHVLALRGIVADGDVGVKEFSLGGSESALITSSIGMVFDQRDLPLRGYPTGLDSLRGDKARLATAEWRFPIKRVERGIMMPPLGLDQLSAAIFYDIGNAWRSIGAKGEKRRGSGVELYGDTYLLYRFPLRFRLGYAHGRDEGGEDQFYLRLGTAF